MLDYVPWDPQLEINIAGRGYSKGVAQTKGPQVLIRPELRFGPLALHGYAKNVSGPLQDGEVGAGLTYRRDVRGFEIAGSAVAKSMINPASQVDSRAAEFAFAIARTNGTILPRVSVMWSPEDLGATGESAYWEGGLGFSPRRRLTGSVALGKRLRNGAPDYLSYNAGLSYRLTAAFTADLRWFGTNQSGLGDPYKSRVVGALRAKL
jgi:hypothetical protein